MKAELFRDIASRYASLVGRRDGVQVVFKPGIYAYTDGKTIVIPDVPYGTILSEHQMKVYGGYLDHEAAHCRETDFPAFKGLTGEVKWLQNILEDVRIENLQISRYPGMKAYLDALCEEVDSRSPRNPNRIIASLYKEVWKYRGVNVHQIPETLDGLGLSSTAALVAQIRELVSTEQTVKLAKRILEMLKHEVKQQEEQRNEQKNQQGKQQEKDGGSIGAQGQAAPSPSQPDSKPDKGPSGERDHEAQNDVGVGSSEPSDPGSSGASSGQNSTGSMEAPEQGAGGPSQQELDEALAEMERDRDDLRKQALQDALQGETEEATAQPKPVPTKRKYVRSGGTMVLPPADKSKDFIMVRPERVATGLQKVEAGRLSRELMRVLQSKDRRAFKRDQEEGDLDTDSLSSVATGNKRVYQVKRDRVGMSTAIEVDIDLSGSMNTGVVRECAMQLSEALNAVPKVKFQICGFHAPEFPVAQGGPGLGRTNHMRFEVLKRFEETYVTSKKYIQAVKAGGFTPLGEAYAIGMENLLRRKEHKKVLLVVTDGMPEFHTEDSRHSDFLLMARVNKTCKKYGILTAGLVIGNIAAFLKEYFQVEESFEQGGQLTDSLMKLVAKLV